MIQWNKENLESTSAIMQILSIAETEWENRKRLQKRLIRKSQSTEIISLDDEKIKIPYEKYITSMVTGYFAGKQPIYSINDIKGDEVQKTIKDILNKNYCTSEQDKEELEILIDYITKYNDDQTEFFELAYDYFGLRACYEIIYQNKDNEIVYSRLSPLNTIGIFDYSAPINQIGQLRKWTQKDNNGNDIEIIELITENGKFYYNGQKNKNNEYEISEDVEKHEDKKWNMLPCIAIENPENVTCYENVISLICAYERVIQNSRNIFKYNDDAKLKITGYRPQNELLIDKRDKDGNVEYDIDGNIVQINNPNRIKEDNQMLKMQVFYTDDGSGDIAWIEKSVQDGALQNHKKTLVDLIAMMSGVPNITDLGFTSAENASAIDRKFFALEQNITIADKLFKKAFLRRWETIIDRINKLKSKNYDFRDIKIELIRNLPTDKQTQTTRALSLRGLLSDETIINMLPDDFNAISELEKVNEQNQENIINNLENLQALSQNRINEDEECNENEENKNDKNIKDNNKNIEEQEEQEEQQIQDNKIKIKR